ncbi:MAG: hypothetical protein AAF685_16390 [Cyanobacteria bacterium P01_C01_bin.89]
MDSIVDLGADLGSKAQAFKASIKDFMGLLLFPESGQNRLLQWALKPRLKLYQWRLLILKILGSIGCIPPATIDFISQRCVLRGRIPH